jgi:hypothetical protein
VKACLAAYRKAEVMQTPEALAKERFLSYVTKKLDGEWDTTAWEFWTWLLTRAKEHKPDHSGLAVVEFQRDRDAAAKARAGAATKGPQKPRKAPRSRPAALKKA